MIVVLNIKVFVIGEGGGGVVRYICMVEEILFIRDIFIGRVERRI